MKKKLKRNPRDNRLILKTIKEVKTWNTKRVLAYKNRLQKHLSYVQTHIHYPEEDFGEQDESQLKFYIEHLKKILNNRENINP